jgi:hypothetical protein
MKYDPLKNYLSASSQERITLSFAEIEAILSFFLCRTVPDGIRRGGVMADSITQAHGWTPVTRLMK